MKKVWMVLICTAVLLSGCAYMETNEPNAEFYQGQTAASTVKDSELVSINPDAAIDIVLTHAGVSRENAVMLGVPSLEEKNGNTHYDVVFACGVYTYDYEVAGSDGSILKAEKEKASEKTELFTKPETSLEPAGSAKSEAAPKPEPSEAAAHHGYIGIETAKQKALDHADVKAEEAVYLKAYYDEDDLIAHYDIKFEANGYEYEYEIRATDGAVLEKDVDKQKSPIQSTPTADAYISADKAKALAFEHAGVKSADVKFPKAELDRGDMIVHYDVEFRVGNTEYEYEINAESGKVIAFDREVDD